MTFRSTSIHRVAFHAFEVLVFLPIYFGLRWLGLAGRSAPWLVCAVLLVFAVLQQPAIQRWMAGGELSRRVGPRLALHLVVMAALLYALGWGPLLGVGFVFTSITHIAMSGAAVWRLAAAWSLIAIGAGQAAIAAGWVYCYLPASYAHTAGLLGATAAVFIIRAVGLAAGQRERAEATVRGSEERFRALVQDSYDVVAVLDRDGRVRYVSPAVTRVSGFGPEALLGTEFSHWIHPDDLAGAAQLIAEAHADSGGQHTIELRAAHPESGWRWYEVTVRNLLDNPAVDGLVVNYRDITERRAIQERLVHDASHDALTGLANRAAFLRELERAVADGRRSGRVPAVLYLDLDGFKQVNDTLGHGAGDALIVNVAAMLRHSVLGSDLVGRLGGDEFGIVLDGVDTVDNAVTVAKRILAEMDLPMWLAGQKVHARASIGVAMLPPLGEAVPLGRSVSLGRSGADAGELLHRADVAMYAAKRRQTHSFQVYVDGLRDPDVTSATLEEELRDAAGADQLRLQYQPIVSLDSGDLIGVEALVRWEHPTRGLLQPQAFIPLAEETGAIGELGEWVLERACRQVREWHLTMPGRRLELSVNLSPRQLVQADLVDRVTAILNRTGFDPADLVLEITESALVDELAAIPQLNALAAQGIRIALDDFGTGYSSLRYLTRLPVNILKIDRCFVAELNGTAPASAVAEAVIRLASILHLDTVAEGIEDAAQATELTLLGCRTGQGFHFARPLDADAVVQLMADARPGWPSLTGPALTTSVG